MGDTGRQRNTDGARDEARQRRWAISRANKRARESDERGGEEAQCSTYITLRKLRLDSQDSSIPIQVHLDLTTNCSVGWQAGVIAELDLGRRKEGGGKKRERKERKKKDKYCVAQLCVDVEVTTCYDQQRADTTLRWRRKAAA